MHLSHTCPTLHLWEIKTPLKAQTMFEWLFGADSDKTRSSSVISKHNWNSMVPPKPTPAKHRQIFKSCLLPEQFDSISMLYHSVCIASKLLEVSYSGHRHFGSFPKVLMQGRSVTISELYQLHFCLKDYKIKCSVVEIMF